MNSILAVVDWIKNTLIPSFFNPSQRRAGLRIHYEFSPAPFLFVQELYAPDS